MLTTTTFGQKLDADRCTIASFVCFYLKVRLHWGNHRQFGSMLPVRMLPSCPVAKRRSTVACFQSLLAASLLVEAGYPQLMSSVAWFCWLIPRYWCVPGIDEYREHKILWDLCNPNYARIIKKSQNLGETSFKVRCEAKEGKKKS